MSMTKIKAKKQKQIIPKFNVTTTAVPNIIGGCDCIISCITGNLWIDALGTAAATTGFKITTGDSICLCVDDSISVISDATGADVQIMILAE